MFETSAIPRGCSAVTSMVPHSVEVVGNVNIIIAQSIYNRRDYNIANQNAYKTEYIKCIVF